MNQPLIARSNGLAFSHYLRTGRWPTVEVKFNPYHDPRNGRFTFAPGGPKLPGSEAVRTRQPLRGSSGAISRREPFFEFSPRNPKNHTIYVVKKGDTLKKIAAKRKYLPVEGFAEFNQIDPDKPIRIGQSLILPNQIYLDAAKAARENAIKLGYYMALHGGDLPTRISKAPDILDPVNWTHEVRNGYDYALDAHLRTRQVSGTITLNPVQRRSGVEQARAGRPDRLPTDEGGHYIAREFNGPTEAFNHFAQDRNFNRSAYRKMELEWKAAANSGMKVGFEIRPHYKDASLRPSFISVRYKIGDFTKSRVFENREGAI